MAVASPSFRPAGCKLLVQPPGPSGRHSVYTRSNTCRPIRCSSSNAQITTLFNEKTLARPQIPSPNSNGSKRVISDQLLGEQLRLLQLESLTKKVLGSSSDSRQLEHSEKERVSRQALATDRESHLRANGWRPPPSSPVEEVLQLLKDADECEEGVVVAMRDWKGYLNSWDVVALLNNLKRWQMAIVFFRWLQRQGSSSLNIHSYNVILKVLRRGRQWKLAERIAEDMIQASILPDNVTYSTLISCANRANYQDDALKWFDKMYKAGCTPDESTYSSMIHVYGKSGHWDEAVALYEGLRESGWRPDKGVYGTMIKIYGKAGNSKQAVMIFWQMKDQGIQPDLVVYDTLLSLLGRLGRSTHAKEIFEEMEKSGVKPTATTLSTIIGTYTRAGDYKAAFRVFQNLKEQGHVCDVVVYNTLIKMCLGAGLVKEAEYFLREMVAAGCQPNNWTSQNMINLYTKRSRISRPSFSTQFRLRNGPVVGPA